jgi:hypothetical protein
LTIAITRLAITQTTMMICIQIQKGDTPPRLVHVTERRRIAGERPGRRCPRRSPLAYWWYGCGGRRPAAAGGARQNPADFRDVD